MSVTPNDVLVGLNQTQPTLNVLQELSSAPAMGRTFSKRLGRTIVTTKDRRTKCFRLRQDNELKMCKTLMFDNRGGGGGCKMGCLFGVFKVFRLLLGLLGGRNLRHHALDVSLFSRGL